MTLIYKYYSVLQGIYCIAKQLSIKKIPATQELQGFIICVMRN